MPFRAEKTTYDPETRVYQTKCRKLAIGSNKWFSLDLNPVVTLFSAAAIWGLVIWCIVEPVKSFAEMTPWMFWITDTSTWLYIGTQDVWLVFIIYLFFSKYGKLKLGKDDEEPEYSDVSYFAMLFSSGLGIGLFYFGVAEPISHYMPGNATEYYNRYWDRYSDNMQAQDAINVTYFHWGFHGYVVYCMIGLNLAFVSYRWELPMTVRTCFYPIIGEHIYGWLGDLIDILSCVATMFGVCTSLGFGVGQLNEGINRLNSDIEVSTNNQVIIIWSVTAVATLSVISGIKIGIRRLSEICFSLGCFILLIIIFYDNTWYVLNVVVQSIGYYLNTGIALGFHTDAFAQEGISLDGKENTRWMNDWTIFYWGWWMAWSPFVGMFIAKISRGRTVRQFILYTMTLPILYVFLWMGVFGGIGIKMEREAFHAGITCDSEFGGSLATEPGPNGLYRLSCRTSGNMWFDVVNQYEGIGMFLSVVSIISLVLYFVTSSDSGSLVIDCLSANGHPDPPIVQRLFWALTEGACATGLLVAGGSKALTALQVVAIASGLPYTIVMNFMCVALWRTIKVEAGDKDPNGPEFSVSILDSFHKIKNIPKILMCIFIPWYFIGRASGKMENKRAYVAMAFMAIAFYATFILQIAEIFHQGLAYIGWAIFIGFVAYASGIRTSMRLMYDIDGNMIEDFFCVLLLYPLAAFQMHQHMEENDSYSRKKKDDDLTMNGLNGTYGAEKPPVGYSPNNNMNNVYVIDEMPVESIKL